MPKDAVITHICWTYHKVCGLIECSHTDLKQVAREYRALMAVLEAGEKWQQSIGGGNPLYSAITEARPVIDGGK